MVSPIDFPTLSLKDSVKQRKIIDRLSCVVVEEDRQNRIREVFLDEMRLGLAINPSRPSSLQMDNTYVDELTNGSETGEFLALDLGGTNFRVILIRMKEGKILEEIVEYYEVCEEYRLGTASQLFDFLASCIADFVSKNNIEKKTHNLGFTFSFPMTQKAIDKAYLNTWTKSFNCKGVVGEDVGALLEQAIIKRKDLDVHVAAVLNDTTGTLIQGSYLDRRCAIGMILGTGNNGCYIERASNIEKWEDEQTDKEVIVDIEWGAFGDNGVLQFLRTQWDDAVDQKSLLVNSFTFEKYIAGRYLGDVIREALFTLASEGLFGKGGSNNLGKLHALKTSTVADIEGEYFKGKCEEAKATLESLGITHDDDDVKILQYVCSLFSYRAVLLVSLICGLLLQRMKRPHCTIAIDGSLYEGHPRFKPLLEHLISKYTPENPFSLMLTKDGSGKGAGLMAAIRDRHRKTAK